MTKFNVGISACLMGHKVRFNAGHKRSDFCDKVLSQQANLLPICPEVAIGLPVPRQAIRLLRDGEQLKVVPSPSHGKSHQAAEQAVDYSEELMQQGHDFIARHPDLDGFVFMNDSPSCGPAKVKTYRSNGYQADRDGVGAFARAVQLANPLLPFEDAGRLNDEVIRENFMVRLGVYQNWRLLNQQPLTMGRLVAFYSPYKYLLMAHSQQSYRAVGPVLANHDRKPVADVAAEMIKILMTGLQNMADRKGHTNVLQHLAGYLRRQLPSDDRQELRQAILDYRAGVTPLIAPLMLFKHHLRASSDGYLLSQHYWQPHAQELGLRSAI